MVEMEKINLWEVTREDFPTLRTAIKDYEFIMTWLVNKLCDYRCTYCCFDHEFLSKEHPGTGKYSHKHIAGCFDRTGKRWFIILSGGEPFLYPDFTGLCEALTQNHHIAVNTNLSSKSIYDFGEMVNPEKVVLFNASMHPEEIDGRKDGFIRYVEKFLFLQEKKFPVYLSYVAYPPLLDRMPEDIQLFKAAGIQHSCVRYYYGEFNGKQYPASYTREEKEKIGPYMSYPFEAEEYHVINSFYRKMCAAGKKFFAMDITGNLKRCSTLSKQYGNFFSGKYRFDAIAKPCPTETCICPHEGHMFAENKKGSLLSVYREMLLEKYYLRKSMKSPL